MILSVQNLGEILLSLLMIQFIRTKYERRYYVIVSIVVLSEKKKYQVVCEYECESNPRIQ